MTIADRFIKRFEPQIAAVLGAVRRAERFLGPEDDWVEDDRRILFEWADSLLRPLGRSTVKEKSEGDYITTAHAEPDVIERVLMEDGDYQRNLLSTRKYRVHHSGGRQWAVGAFVVDDGHTQHHVFLFKSPDGGTDIYAHQEASVQRPSAHDGGDEFVAGYPGPIPKLLDNRGIDYGRRNF